MRKYQYYNTNDDDDRDIYTANYGAQTFTPGTTHLLGKVKLKLFRVGSPGTATISIKGTINSKPAGGALCSGTLDADVITDDSGGEWYEITLGDGAELAADTMYAIEVKAPDGDASNKLSWRADITSPTFTGGTYCTSTDSAVDWSTVSGVDIMFEEWGVGPPSTTTITWGELAKSQISAEKIEAAVDRLIQNHEDDENAHLEAGESLYSHKASEIIDHIANSIITDKILDGMITNPKIEADARAYTAIVKTGITEDEILRPSGAGSETNLTPLPGTNANWENVKEVIADENATMVLTDNDASFVRDLYAIPSLSDSSPIEAVVIFIRCDGRTANGAEGDAKAVIKTHSTVYESPEKHFDNDWENFEHGWTVNPYTGDPWTTQEITDLEIGVSIKMETGASWCAATQVYARIIKRTVSGAGIFGTVQSAIEYVHGLTPSQGSILILPGTYQPTGNITLYSNIDLLGLDPLSTIIDFQNVVTRRFEAIGEASPYSTGTITTVQDDATITGTNTLWSANLTADDYIQIGTAWFKIASITDNTHLELVQPWRGKALSGLTYEAGTMLENISVKGLTIKRGGDTQFEATPGNALFAYCIDLIVQNNYFLDAPGVTVWFSHCSKITFKDNYPQTGVEAGAHFGWVTHSLIDNNKGGGSKQWDFSFYLVKKSTISNNYSPGGGEDGFTFNGCENNSIFGNVSENNVKRGFQFAYGSQYNNIFGNKAIDNTLDGFYFLGHASEGWPSYNTINGNIAEGNGNYGINITDANIAKIIITANQIRNNTSGSINDTGTGTIDANNIKT